MALEQILSRINREAEERADALMAAAREQANAIAADAQTSADQTRSQILLAARERADRDRERVLTLARLEHRKLQLGARQRVIARAFDQALSDLVDMPEAEYLELLARLVAESARGEDTILLNERDRARLGPELVQRVNSRLTAEGKAAGLRLGEATRPISGGAVLVRGRLEANLSFDSALSQVRDEAAIEAARALFPNEGDGEGDG